METTLTDIHEAMIDKLLEDSKKFNEAFAYWQHPLTDEDKEYFESKGCKLSRFSRLLIPCPVTQLWLVQLPE